MAEWYESIYSSEYSKPESKNVVSQVVDFFKSNILPVAESVTSIYKTAKTIPETIKTYAQETAQNWSAGVKSIFAPASETKTSEKKTNYLPYIIGGIALILLFFFMRKK